MQLDAEAGGVLRRFTAIGAHRLGDLGPHLIPDTTVAGSRESQYLQGIRAVHDRRRDRLLHLVHLDAHLGAGEHGDEQAAEIEPR
jgi:hypothetical protein